MRNNTLGSEASGGQGLFIDKTNVDTHCGDHLHQTGPYFDVGKGQLPRLAALKGFDTMSIARGYFQQHVNNAGRVALRSNEGDTFIHGRERGRKGEGVLTRPLTRPYGRETQEAALFPASIRRKHRYGCCGFRVSAEERNISESRLNFRGLRGISNKRHPTEPDNEVVQRPCSNVNTHASNANASPAIDAAHHYFPHHSHRKQNTLLNLLHIAQHEHECDREGIVIS
jgi:hypothetical protein